MSRAAFIDANIPIYAGGRSHRSKEPCSRVLWGDSLLLEGM